MKDECPMEVIIFFGSCFAVVRMSVRQSLQITQPIFILLKKKYCFARNSNGLLRVLYRGIITLEKNLSHSVYRGARKFWQNFCYQKINCYTIIKNKL